MTQSDTQPAHIRVLMEQVPRMIYELLRRRIGTTQHMELVENTDGNLVERVRKNKVDIVILGVDDAYPPQTLVGDLLRNMPKVRVIALQVRDDVMMEYWLGIRSLSTQALNSDDPIERIQALFARDVME